MKSSIKCQVYLAFPFLSLFFFSFKVIVFFNESNSQEKKLSGSSEDFSMCCTPPAIRTEQIIHKLLGNYWMRNAHSAVAIIEVWWRGYGHLRQHRQQFHWLGIFHILILSKSVQTCTSLCCEGEGSLGQVVREVVESSSLVRFQTCLDVAVLGSQTEMILL